MPVPDASPSPDPTPPQYEVRPAFPNDKAQNIKEITLKNGMRVIYVEFTNPDGTTTQKVLQVIPAPPPTTTTT